MFDLNTIINAALNAAVQQAIAPLMERIENLDAICQTQHEAMVAMRDRITALEDTGDRLYARIAALENNPAQGVEPAITIDEARMVEALNSQEWFWDKLRNFIDAGIDAGIESAIDMHCETYDHDSYDSVVSDSDDFVRSGDLEDAVREAVGNLSFEVSVS